MVDRRRGMETSSWTRSISISVVECVSFSSPPFCHLIHPISNPLISSSSLPLLHLFHSFHIYVNLLLLSWREVFLSAEVGGAHTSVLSYYLSLSQSVSLSSLSITFFHSFSLLLFMLKSAHFLIHPSMLSPYHSHLFLSAHPDSFSQASLFCYFPRILYSVFLSAGT